MPIPSTAALPPPWAVTPSSTWPLHDSASTRAWEAQALARPGAAGSPNDLGATPQALPSAQPPSVLMQAAGLATARLALALTPHAPLIQVHAGPGNNGGDGWIAATELHRQGRAVQVLDCSDGHQPPEDAKRARQQALQAGVPWDRQRHDLDLLPKGSLLVDALLGLGAQTRGEGRLAAAINDLRLGADRGHTVLAVDLPSGLHPDTGQPTGPWAVRAHHTLSLLTLKPGLFTGQGRDHAGQVWLHRLGSADPGHASGYLSGRPEPAPRWHGQHKGSFGDVAVLGGAPGMAGALALAARAALCGGAGRVFAWALDPLGAPLDATWPELMHRQASAGLRLGSATVVAGCGGGQAIAQHLPALLAASTPLVLDADALNAVALSPALQAALAARLGPCVLTPHPLEAARLLGTDTATVQADRIAAAQALARRFQSVALLKGSGTVIASPAGHWRINPTGNALLASAGTGDVLAGLLGGLWSAQAQTPTSSCDPPASAALQRAFEAACAAAWWHGHAADQAWQSGRRQALRASELVLALEAGWRQTGSPG